MRHYRHNPDEDIRALERVWRKHPADTQASRSYFRALARAGELPDVSSTEPEPLAGYEEQIQALSDLFERADTSDVEDLVARIDELDEFSTVRDLEALVGMGELTGIARTYWLITKLMRKHLTRGTYQEPACVQGFMNLVDRAAQRALSGYLRSPWHVQYPIELRRHFATWLARRFESRWGAGIYRDWPRSKTGLKRFEREKPKQANGDDDLRELERAFTADPTDYPAAVRLVRAACRARDYKLARRVINELTEQREEAGRDLVHRREFMDFEVGDDLMEDADYAEIAHRYDGIIDALGEAFKEIPDEARSGEYHSDDRFAKPKPHPKRDDGRRPRTSNPDEERRRRARKALGDPVEQTRVLADRLRTGGLLDTWFVRAAATMGHMAALELAEPFEANSDRTDLLWTDEYLLRANMEGWNIFDSDSYGLQIQTLDEPEEGGSLWEGRDRETRLYAWLVERAKQGDRHAITALLIVRQDLSLDYILVVYPRFSEILKRSGYTISSYWDLEVSDTVMDKIRARAHEAELAIADSFLFREG
jgi:hypothetical protein